MSPAWIALGLTAAGIAALSWATPRARAAEQPPAGRVWAIERCVGERCEVLGWRYSGPTACAVDAQSERIGKQVESGVRLVCVRLDNSGGKR